MYTSCSTETGDLYVNEQFFQVVQNTNKLVEDDCTRAYSVLESRGPLSKCKDIFEAKVPLRCVAEKMKQPVLDISAEALRKILIIYDGKRADNYVSANFESKKVIRLQEHLRMSTFLYESASKHILSLYMLYHMHIILVKSCSVWQDL